MFYHKKCKELLKIDVTDYVRVLADFSIIGKYTAQVTGLVFHEVSEGRIPIKFFCRRCNQFVEDFKEMIVVCDACGNIFPVLETRTPLISNGIFCADTCIKKFETSEVIHKISIKDIKF